MATIAIDVMGSDQGLAEAVRAAAELSIRGDAHLVLVGEGSQIQSILNRSQHERSRISVHHASQTILMHDDPKVALKTLHDSSLTVSAALVASGNADALVTAGNTGATILACAAAFNPLPGVKRTALAAVFPTERRRGQNDDPFSLILDVGATLGASAETLVTFAHMGAAYAACISGNTSPTVALLSNGTESHKGLPPIVSAHERLRRDERLNFIGNIEGLDLPRGSADVVVTDGFTGNVVLKMLEGIGETVFNLGRYAYRSRWTWRAGLWMLRGGLKQLKDVTDWRQYGGAPILGFDRLCIKAHGRSNQRAIANAIKVAIKASEQNLVHQIGQRIAPGETE